LRAFSKLAGSLSRHPQELGQRETGQHGVGGERDDVVAAHGRVDEIDLGLAALVAPDERRADDLIGRIEQNQAVHLAGKTDRFHVLALGAGGLQNALHGLLGGVPPIARVLLGPAGALHSHVVVWGGEAGGDCAFLVDQQRAAATGSDIKAKASTWKMTPLRVAPGNV